LSDAPAPLAIDVVGRAGKRPDGMRARVIAALEACGADVRRVPDSGEPDPARILWLHGNARWYPRTSRALARGRAGGRPFVVLWHYEPLPLPPAAARRLERMHARELAKVLLRDDRVTDPWSNTRTVVGLSKSGAVDLLVVSSGSAQEFLATRGVTSSVVPLGSIPSDGHDLGLPRDIDVLLLANLDVPRRKRIIRHLRRRGVPLVALGDWNNPEYFGEPRTLLLNRTRILLNIPRHSGLLSGRTMILGMANKALVVAEPVYRPDPYRPGVHYVSAEVADLPDVLARHLDAPDEHAPIVEAAYRFVHEELTFERSVARILALIEERRR
jgi:hypothetical protein